MVRGAPATDRLMLGVLSTTIVRVSRPLAQAHTVGEWIAVAQLREAVEVYTRLIGALCG